MNSPLSPAQMRNKAIIETGKRKSEAINKSTREQNLKNKREAATNRKRQERKRYVEKGLITVTVQIKPAYKETLLQYVEGLNRNDNG